ncbi:MAG: hypothetical protein J7527_10500, partial [Chitinophagaceae bacterium]|nr:hypothetical protein [Chitinophagaceae bacterium]
ESSFSVVSQRLTTTLKVNNSSIPVRQRPFPFWGSTVGKQTLNGLFYVMCQSSFLSANEARMAANFRLHE